LINVKRSAVYLHVKGNLECLKKLNQLEVTSVRCHCCWFQHHHTVVDVHHVHGCSHCCMRVSQRNVQNQKFWVIVVFLS